MTTRWVLAPDGSYVKADKNNGKRHSDHLPDPLPPPLSASPTTAVSTSPPLSVSIITRGLTGGDGIYTPEVNARILESLGPPNEVLLLSACATGDVDEVDRLLRNTSVSVDCEDEFGDTGLLLACRNGQVEVVKRLLQTRGKKGIDVNRAPRGWTPLLAATSKGHVEIVKLLLADSRTEITATTPAGDSALHIACRITSNVGNTNNETPIKDLLVELLSAGLDPNQTNESGWTPFLLLCARNPHLVPCFLSAASQQSQSPTSRSTINLSQRTKQGNMALHLLALHDSTGLAISHLLSLPSCNPNARLPAGGWTAFHLACFHGNIPTISALSKSGSCNVFAETEHGATGFVLAAQNGQREAVRYLTKNGMDRGVVVQVEQVVKPVNKREAEEDPEEGVKHQVKRVADEQEGFATPAAKRAKPSALFEPTPQSNMDVDVGSPASFWTMDEDARSPSPKKLRSV